MTPQPRTLRGALRASYATWAPAEPQIPFWLWMKELCMVQWIVYITDCTRRVRAPAAAPRVGDECPPTSRAAVGTPPSHKSRLKLYYFTPWQLSSIVNFCVAARTCRVDMEIERIASRPLRCPVTGQRIVRRGRNLDACNEIGMGISKMTPRARRSPVHSEMSNEPQRRLIAAPVPRRSVPSRALPLAPRFSTARAPTPSHRHPYID